MDCIAAGYGAERLLEDQAVGSMSDMAMSQQLGLAVSTGRR
jgi:hypothetical protein